MKKLIVIAVILTAGCSSITNVVDDFTKAVDNINSMFKPLTMREFCSLKESDVNTAKARYQNKGYIFKGQITDIKKSADHTVIGIKDTQDNSTVFGKVYNYSGQKKGQIIKLQGIISPANFDSKNRKQCRILLDNGKINS